MNVANVSFMLRLGIVLTTCLVGCEKQESDLIVPRERIEVAQVDQEDLAFEKQIVAFCGDCHGMPRPSSFPKRSWAKEVDQGYRLYHRSNRTDLTPPVPTSRVVAYFKERAPFEFSYEISETAPSSPVGFIKREIRLTTSEDHGLISHLRFCRESNPLGTGLLVCDMRQGHLLWTTPDSRATAEVVEQFDNPAHVTVCDLNQDSIDDFLVADLGSFQPSDHAKGKLHWLYQAENGQWEKKVLLANVGRVSSAETGDFDGDGSTDIVVAEFGWRETGAIHLLKNRGVAGEVEFEPSEIDPRSGTIDVQRCDLNGDGNVDFVALLAQEHEAVVAFLNRGDATFEPNVIWEANYPSYGSSGFELVDMDADGDLDVIYTNGDSFDDFHLKPYHFVQWLENEGQYPYRRHPIAEMPGVHRALPGDFDGDGDLDIVAVGLLPKNVEAANVKKVLGSIVLFEQQPDQQFARHPLELGEFNHATLTVADFDDDSDLDFVVQSSQNTEGAVKLTWWLNQLIPESN